VIGSGIGFAWHAYMNRLSTDRRQHWGPFLAALFLISSSTAEAQGSRVFDEERRVTALDVLVTFEAGAMREWVAGGPVPKEMSPDDFSILYDGEPSPVIAVDPSPSDWEIVVFFDAVLSSTVELRWAATVLAENAEQLTQLGTVTLIVADPEPVTRLAPTREADHLHAVLSQIAQTQRGVDELVALRGEVIAEFQREGSELTVETLAELVVGEGQRARERLETLLLTVVERESASSRRALILAHGGFDIYPEIFYEPLKKRRQGSVGQPVNDARQPAFEDGVDLVSATRETARTLAAYGWVLFHLRPPEKVLLKEGKRIGKFRLSGPGIVYDEANNRTFFKFFGATFEEHRKPERAEAYLELGSALEGQGKLEEAEDALRQALYYFSRDPRTAESQAEALVRLAKVLDAQNKNQEATAALDHASRLDPNRAIAAGYAPTLLEPQLPLKMLSRTTAGRVVRGAPALSDFLAELSRRVRLTYQVTGYPDGLLHTLKAQYHGPARRSLSHVGWARSATPEMVAAVRARRLLESGTNDGELQVEIGFQPEASGERDLRGQLRLSLETQTSRLSEAEAKPSVTLRVTVAFGYPDDEPSIVHHSPKTTAMSAAGWSQSLALQIPEGSAWLAVVVEDLQTGSWGGRLLELL